MIHARHPKGAKLNRCQNFLTSPGFTSSIQCNRVATGDDGLCNVCRAAILRGKRAQARNDEARRKRDAASAARRRQEYADRTVGEWLRQNDPEKYQAIIDDGANQGANHRDET